MATCTHLPTQAKCEIIGGFSDGKRRYYTLKEIVQGDGYARTFTADEEEIKKDELAQVLPFAKPVREEVQAQPEPVNEPVVVEEKKDPAKVYINDKSLTKEALANSVIQGIGPITAGRILTLRDSLPDGKFTALDQIKTIKGINWDAYAESIVF
ncbi:hypothetical protein [Nodosilinea nodulosa]|uniref:hypothetical protein n=1 Tax=Nodosilinea nodulosa TaxID=416001 RepID=UPI00030B997C|nr:hypothetical protein [Nodosilinea nodulosa]